MHKYIDIIRNILVWQALLNPNDLKAMLKGASSTLPDYNRLPNDPESVIWLYLTS